MERPSFYCNMHVQQTIVRHALCDEHQFPTLMSMSVDAVQCTCTSPDDEALATLAMMFKLSDDTVPVDVCKFS